MPSYNRRDHQERRYKPKSAEYEAEFSQSEAKAVTASAKKFVEKAAALLDLISQ
jgi:hypothetical protein